MRIGAALLTLAALVAGASARADEPPPPPTNEQIVAAVKADANPAPPAVTSKEEEAAPPPLPRHRGVVLESGLGGLVFVGKFRQVAPPAPWFHLLAGYELFPWLMFFGEGELAFTDTSVAQDASKARAFPMFGFDGGARFTVHVSERVALYAQGSIGAMKADIANNALALVGFRDAESLGLSLAGRLGVEWYQLDRHIALGLAAGVRDAKGFARSDGQSDLPLMIDVALALRYTF